MKKNYTIHTAKVRSEVSKLFKYFLQKRMPVKVKLNVQ